MMEAIDHELVSVDEFDALAIEIQASSGPSHTKYPARQHVKKVMKELGATRGIIYLAGQADVTWEDSDLSMPFRQRRYFYYITGADFPGCAATYDVRHDRLVLWIPYVAPRYALYYGSTPTPEECMARSDVDEVRYASELPAYLCGALPAARVLYALHDDQLPPSLAASFREHHTLREVRVDTTALLPAMAEARVTKTAFEIGRIRRANDVSAAAHAAVLRGLRGFGNEREVEAAFAAACTASPGGKRQAYGIIAGSGPNAATLHYGDNDQALRGREVLVLDAGAEVGCYASDVTRTLPLCWVDGGKGKKGKMGFSREAQAIYDLVDAMQAACIAGVRPGASYRSLQVLAHAVAARGLLKLGILRGGSSTSSAAVEDVVEDVLAGGTTAAFFPHGLGHHIGLETHDVAGKTALYSHSSSSSSYDHARRPLVSAADISAMVAAEQQQQQQQDSSTTPTTTRILAPSMVLTIEPGLYFNRPYIEQLFLSDPRHARYIDAQVLERYWAVGGVRIEDDVLVTDDGCENLTTAPKGEEALRIINGE